MTSITMPRRLMRPLTTRPTLRGILLGFFGTVLAAAILIGGLTAGMGVAWGGTVMPGVTVGGISLAGLDPSEAARRLEERLPSLSSGSATVAVGERSEQVSYADLGRRWDVESMVTAALAAGRAENPIADGIGRLRALVHPTALPVVVHPYDVDALEQISAEVAAALTTEPTDSVVSADGSSFSASASRPGRAVEASTVASALAAAADTTQPSDVLLRLEPQVVAPSVDTSAGRALAAAANAMAGPLELTIPGAAEDEEPMTLGSDTIASWISFGATDDGEYGLALDEESAAAAIEALVAEVDQEPVNARITVASGGGLAGVVPGQDGRALDVEESTAVLLATLRDRGAGETGLASMPLVVDVTEPALSTARAQEIFPRMQMESSWTTTYVPGEGNGWGNNINIPARDIDGKNLAPGEVFSFWGSVGPITEERGFGYGGAIINGRSTQGVAIGGGICSTSTTIFNAALRAGLEMGIRLNHYYYIDRYPDGLDATVSIIDDWVQDMTFRNDTDNPIVIRGFGGNGFVTFQIWSVPLDRQIVITDAVTSNHKKAIDTTVVDDSLAPGTSKRVEYPHDGHDVSRTRFVYDAAGNLIHRNDYFSSYRTVNGIVLVGPSAAAEAPEPPAEEAGDTAGDGVVPPGDGEQP
jgi:vancomycin resistance protein YoaR